MVSSSRRRSTTVAAATAVTVAATAVTVEDGLVQGRKISRAAAVAVGEEQSEHNINEGKENGGEGCNNIPSLVRCCCHRCSSGPRSIISAKVKRMEGGGVITYHAVAAAVAVAVAVAVAGVRSGRLPWSYNTIFEEGKRMRTEGRCQDKRMRGVCHDDNQNNNQLVRRRSPSGRGHRGSYRTDNQTDRRTDRQTDRQTVRHTNCNLYL